MSIMVYSFPRSGNFLITRAIAHSFESNIYHCLQTLHIRDLHRLPLHRNRDYESYCEEFGAPSLQDPNSHCTAEGGDYLIYKSHTAALVHENRDSIDCVVVIIRRPTYILRSHIQHQYLSVPALDEDLISHTRFVYLDQLNFLEHFLTIRACLEAGQDGWLQVISNALLMNLPVFLVDYDDAVKNIWNVVDAIAEQAYGRKVLMPADYQHNMSKDSFLATQERILEYYIRKYGKNWDGVLFKSNLAGLTKWAYENDMRLISKKNSIYSAIREMPPASHADTIYSCIKNNVPAQGLFLSNESMRRDFLQKILDTLSVTMRQCSVPPFQDQGHGPGVL